MGCGRCGFESLPGGARFCPQCGAPVAERFAEINVSQNIAAGTEGVTGVQLGEVQGSVTMNVFQVNLPPELVAELAAVPTEVRPPNSGDGVTPARRESVKQSLGQLLAAARQSPEVRAVQMGNLRVSRADLLIKEAVLLKTEAEQMMLDMVTRNQDAVDRAKAASPGAKFQIDLAELMSGFDGEAHQAKLRQAFSRLEEAIALEPANTEALLHLAQVRDQLDSDSTESRKLLYRVQQLLSNPKDDIERFRLAQSTYLLAVTGETVHPDMIAGARAMFERLGRVEWVRFCDERLKGAHATQPQFPAGEWQVQASDGRVMLVCLYANGTFQSQLVNLGIPVQGQGQWGFHPQSGVLAFQGLINGFQPFAVQIGITGQQPNGFYGFGGDGIQYVFERR